MRRVDNANQSAGAGAGSFNNYQFDFGLGNGFPKGSSNAPLKDQKQPGSASPWSSPVVPPQAPPASQSAAASSGWSAGGSYQAGSGWSGGQKSTGGGGGLGGGSKTPSQTTGWSGYQPMTPGLGGGGSNKSAGAGLGSGSLGGGGGFQSMNGAPMMKSSSSIRSDSSRLASAGVFGLAQNQSSKGADVFGDLLGPALNRSKAPLNSQPGPKLPFAMGNLDSSLPKPAEGGGVASSQQQIPMAKMAKQQPATAAHPPPKSAPAPEPRATRRPTQNSAERDPFPPVSAGTSSSNVSYESDFFSFPGAPSPAVNGSSGGGGGVSQDDAFGFSGGSSSSSNTNMGGGSSADPFGFGGLPNQQTARSATSGSPSPMAGAGADPFDVFKAAPSAAASQSRQFPVAEPYVDMGPDDGWGMFGGSSVAGDNEPTTTELEGLPPPPLGVTAQAATDKGSEFYKNGQFPDAIKWFSWSVELLKKGNPNKELLLENLSCRVSCYKEIGEMKKAVADCTQAIGLDKTNTSLIMLRSSLYESMEKYKLGVADLKLVLKIDANHRQARSTLMRLERMIDQ